MGKEGRGGWCGQEFLLRGGSAGRTCEEGAAGGGGRGWLGALAGGRVARGPPGLGHRDVADVAGLPEEPSVAPVSGRLGGGCHSRVEGSGSGAYLISPLGSRVWRAVCAHAGAKEGWP